MIPKHKKILSGPSVKEAQKIIAEKKKRHGQYLLSNMAKIFFIREPW